MVPSLTELVLDAYVLTANWAICWTKGSLASIGQNPPSVVPGGPQARAVLTAKRTRKAERLNMVHL